SREEIAQAWRRRARDEHPDARPADADAPGRFRALAEAWRVLGAPGRRAAYDRALARERPPATRVPAAGARMPVRRPAGQGGAGPLVRAPGPPLRAGPGARRGRHPPVLPPGHRPAPGDLRADRRRAEPGRHPPGPAVAGGDPPAAGRAGPAERTDRCPPGPCGTEPEAAYPSGRWRVAGQRWPGSALGQVLAG